MVEGEVQKEALQGPGAGACWLHPHGNLGFEKGWFSEGRMEDFAAGTIPGSHGSPIGSRGGLRRAFGTSGVVEKLSKLTNLAFSPGESRIRLTLNLSGGRTFSETTRERVAIIEGTFQDWAFPQENIAKSCGFVVNSGITKGVLFGFR